MEISANPESTGKLLCWQPPGGKVCPPSSQHAQSCKGLLGLLARLKLLSSPLGYPSC